MTSRVDPATLPHVTPTQLSEAAYAAEQERKRFKPVNGIPDARATWRPTVDPALMRSISARAFDAHRESIAPPDVRERIASMLLAELDRLYPPADMGVLNRYGFAVARDSVVVQVARVYPGSESFSIPPRYLPQGARGAHIFKVSDQVDASDYPLAPSAALPVLEALGMAWSSKAGDFDHARDWPLNFKRRNSRQPRWREVEDAFPRIAAWLAEMRGKA
jgi:hypothetical protein